ncbi:acyltransferase [Loa loa]|uniref:Acyltransferase n=2 Tax=Loa loa TaxID=7209 RepID=A0A1S0U238_LOALO|nr:acyltransferase [Loa loa]EFO23260.1 acyltransferase [Loa loa]
MLQTGDTRIGLDGPTVTAEDGFLNKVMISSMDVRKVIALIGAFYWTIMTVFVVPGIITATFLTVMIPTLCISVSWFNWLDHKLCRMVNDHWSSAVQIAGINIVEYGDDISQLSEKRVLFLANHLGLADHFVIMSALRNKGTVVEKYLWVIYNIWKMTPMGVMWTIHGNYFVDGGAAKRDQMIENFKTHLKRNYWKYDHRWIIMYPEGARLYRIKESNARYAAREGYKVFRHCALPRTGAAHATIEITTNADYAAIKDTNASLEYIVDCTLGYQNGDVPSIGNWLLGELPNGIPNVAVHYKIYRIRPEWKDENILKHWLYDIYEKKDELLEKYYQSGIFPMDSQHHPTVVRTSMSRCLFVEAFWLSLLYLHYTIWMKSVAGLIYRCFVVILFAFLGMF